MVALKERGETLVSVAWFIPHHSYHGDVTGYLDTVTLPTTVESVCISMAFVSNVSSPSGVILTVGLILTSGIY